MRLILALAAGVLGYCYYRGQAAKVTKVAVKEDLRRWEGEGGNVPAVATPSPLPTAEGTIPDSSVRH